MDGSIRIDGNQKLIPNAFDPLPDSEMIKDDTDKLSSSYKVLERLCLKTLLGGPLSSLKQ